MTIFEFVKSKIFILELVQEYVQLKRAGSYHKGSCPFHNETDASFTVSPDKGIFYCFGCHAGGDIISFTAKAENLSQIEAAQFLLDKFNIKLPETIKNEFSKTAGKSPKKDLFFKVCQAVRDWTHERLRTNSLAREYVNRRQITDHSIIHFKIGYFPGGIKHMNTFLKDMARQNILLADLVEAGIVMQGQQTPYSPFEERILFPIHNSLGRCCGFGGRIFHDNDQRAKYYNSKESPWFSKGKLLFAFDTAKKEIQFSETAFLVEGYTDCVAMIQAGYKNTVATLGTACTLDHLKQVGRFARTLYVLYDGDSAGQKAILRLTELCWQANLELMIVKLPEKDDPASFLEKGGNLPELLQQSIDIFAFFIDSVGKQFWMKPLSEKIHLCDKLVGVIANIDNPLKQDLLLQRAAAATQIPLSSFQSLLHNKAGQKKRSVSSHLLDEQKASKYEVQAAALQGITTLEERLFATILSSLTSETLLQVEDDLMPYFSQPMQQLLATISAVHKESTEKKIIFDEFLHRHNKEEQNWILQISVKYDTDTSPKEMLEKLSFQFRKQHWKQMVQDMKQRIFDAKQNNNTKQLAELLNSFAQLKQKLKTRGLL